MSEEQIRSRFMELVYHLIRAARGESILPPEERPTSTSHLPQEEAQRFRSYGASHAAMLALQMGWVTDEEYRDLLRQIPAPAMDNP